MCNQCVMENVKQSMLSRRSLFKGAAVAGAAVVGGGRHTTACIRKFGNLLRPGHALHIALDQFGLGPAPDAPARDDVQQHDVFVHLR